VIGHPTCDRCGNRLSVHTIVTRVGTQQRMRRAECINHECPRTLFRRPADEPAADWTPVEDLPAR
jgi:hypothetical protein